MKYNTVECNAINPKLFFRLVIGGDFDRLKSEGFLARKGVAPIHISFPLSWRSKDSNVEFNLHAWRFLSAAWSYYVKNPTDVVAAEVFEFAVDLARDWVSFLETKKSKYAWYDMSVGIRAMHIAFIIYIIDKHSIGSENDIALITRLAEEHIDWLSVQKNITKGNHAIYQVVGLQVLSSVYGKDTGEYAQYNMSRLLDDAFDSSFVTTENSPFYHKYNVDIFKRVPPELFPGLKDKLESLFSKAPLVTKWLTAPNGSFYRIGDTEGDGVSLTSKDVESVSEKAIFKDFGGSGYQVVRSHPNIKKEDSFSLMFRGKLLSYVHSHCDALSFILFLNGEEVFSDPGKFTYEYGGLRDWFISDASHSTAGLSGVSFFPKDVDIDGCSTLPLMANRGAFFFSGQVIKKKIFIHNRRILFQPDSVILISDLCQSEAQDNIEVRFILGPGVSYSGGKIGVLKTPRGKEYKMRFTGDIEEVNVIQAQDCRAWVSSSYHEKEPVCMIVLKCSNSVASTDASIILS